MKTVETRRLRPSDHQDVLDLVLGEGGLGISAAFNWPEEALAPELKEQPGWGVFENRVLAGYVLWREMDGWNEITTLACHPRFQRRGLMRRLLSDLFDAHSRKLWRLEVHERNVAARALYESVGFEQLGKRTRYYKDGTDALVLERADP